MMSSLRTCRRMMGTVMRRSRSSCFFDNLARYLEGEALRNVVRHELEH
jgi:hypothetical protein